MKRGDFLAMNIIDEQLKIGQVKSITSDFGRTVDYTELLFSPTTKAQFQPNKGRTALIFSVSDGNFDLPEMVCELDRETLRNLIVSLKNMYNELKEQDIPAVEENVPDTKMGKPESFCCSKTIL